jgi:hypothetical protein
MSLASTRKPRRVAMRSRTLLILMPLLVSSALLSTGCAHRAPSPSLELTPGDRTHAADAGRPTFGKLAEPAPTGVAERNYLFATVIRPLLAFSIAQEETTAEERQRADAVVAKVDALNQATHTKRRKFLGLF